MNAQLEFLRAKASPLALSTAIALALAFSATAQAQYSYPGTASSSGHSAHISPIRAGARRRAEYGTGPARGGPQRGHGNPSMQRGEACPPGSNCGIPSSGRQQSGGSGGPGPAGAYGAHESYGAAPSPAHAANAIHPIQAGGGEASISPVQAGHGALNYGTSQSAASYRNTVNGQPTGPNTNVTGQQTSFAGPNGKQVNMGNPTSFTGPNGQKQTIGGGPDLNNLGAGSGHQKGSEIKQGMSYSADGNGSISGTRTGSAPGMASANGLNMNNGGVSGVETGDHTNPNFQKGQSKDGGVAVYDGLLSNSVYNHTGGDGEPHDAHPDNGIDRNGTEWKGGKVWDGTDSNGVKWRNGVQSSPGKMKNTSVADTGATAGPGEIVSGTGEVVHPGQKKGQDTGGSQTDDGTSHSGGQNAQGQYIAPSGQDNVKKPKEVGVLKMNYNGKNGAIDPKLNGGNGGGG